MTQKEYVNPSYRKSDHPSFRDKKHTLLIDNQGASNRKIQTESGTLKFENGVAVLPDDTRAKDIYDEIVQEEAMHPNQYTIIEDKPTVSVDQIHNYTFGYSHRFASAWERAFGNHEDDQEKKEELNGTVRREDTTECSASELQSEA